MTFIRLSSFLKIAVPITIKMGRRLKYIMNYLVIEYDSLGGVAHDLSRRYF
jgi:hypothetical protein